LARKKKPPSRSGNTAVGKIGVKLKCSCAAAAPANVDSVKRVLREKRMGIHRGNEAPGPVNSHLASECKSMEKNTSRPVDQEVKINQPSSLMQWPTYSEINLFEQGHI
jgi:hypothetical protein